MNIAGSKQRLLIGAWMLAALLLGGLNIYWYMALEQRPLVGYSQTIRTLQARLTQFEELLAKGTWSAKWTGNPQTLFNPSSADGSADINPPTAQTAGELQDRTPDPAILPTLSGIMQVMDPHGVLHFQALLSGHVCRKKDKIGEFMVDQITPAGVLLRRADAKWFIKSPSPFYSNDQGE